MQAVHPFVLCSDLDLAARMAAYGSDYGQQDGALDQQFFQSGYTMEGDTGPPPAAGQQYVQRRPHVGGQPLAPSFAPSAGIQGAYPAAGGSDYIQQQGDSRGPDNVYDNNS